MGAWGHKALESDEGLDVIGFLQDYIENQTNLNLVSLTDIVKAMKNDGFFGDTFKDIDFFYDVSAMALAEIYITYLDTGNFLSDESKSRKVQTWTADENALKFIVKYLTYRDPYDQLDMIQFGWKMGTKEAISIVKQLSRRLYDNCEFAVCYKEGQSVLYKVLQEESYPRKYSYKKTVYEQQMKKYVL